MRRLLKSGLVAVALGILTPEHVLAADLVVSRFSVIFPETQVGTRGVPETVWIRNMSDATAQGLTIQSTCINEFQVFDNCGFELGANQACALQITFQPSRDSFQSCSVQVSSSNAGSARVALSGRGVDKRRRP